MENNYIKSLVFFMNKLLNKTSKNYKMNNVII